VLSRVRTVQINIRKGLEIPLAGPPDQVVRDARPVRTVALLGHDTLGLRPSMLVSPGDRVRLGQPLFNDKQNPGVRFVSPGGGVVAAVNRGERRVLQSVVIELDGDAQESFESHGAGRLDSLGRPAVASQLLASGLWTAFRTRPFSKIPAAQAVPSALFVTAIDTNPLAADPAVVIRAAAEDFESGLRVIARLTDGPVYLCTAPGAGIACPASEQFRHAEFAGPHPAGLVGTHIHLLEPVSERKTVWHIGYQDVIAIGRLFVTGRLSVERVVALAGPLVREPRLVRTRVGASIQDLVAGELEPADTRIISGSVLSGHRAAGWASYLGRYHTQVTVLREGRRRQFLGWLSPGARKYSAERAYAGHLLHRGPFELTTSQNGSPRAMVSIGSFDKVMPLDILPTPLLKALIVRDTDSAKGLGCLELDEEDLALCSFVCNGKYEYGPALRACLSEIEVRG